MQDLTRLVHTATDSEAVLVSHDVFSVDIHAHPHLFVSIPPVPDEAPEANRIRCEGARIAIESSAQPVSGCVQLVDDGNAKTLAEGFPYIGSHAVTPCDFDAVLALILVGRSIQKVSAQFSDVLDDIGTGLCDFGPERLVAELPAEDDS